MSEDQPKFKVSVTQVVASALAATTAAVLASYLGVAGTIAGAALASVVVTIGSAFYRHQLDKTRARLRASALADLRARSQRQAGRAASQGPADADDDPAEAVDPVTDSATVPAVRRITPLRVTVVAVAVFALSLGIITTIEAFAGEPISDTVHGRTGGSRFTITDTGTKSTPSPTPTPAVTVTRSPQAPPRSASPTPSSAVSTAPTGRPPGSRTSPSASTGSTPGQSTASAPAATQSPAPTGSGSSVPSAPGPTGTASQPGQ